MLFLPTLKPLSGRTEGQTEREGLGVSATQGARGRSLRQHHPSFARWTSFVKKEREAKSVNIDNDFLTYSYKKINNAYEIWKSLIKIHNSFYVLASTVLQYRHKDNYITIKSYENTNLQISEHQHTKVYNFVHKTAYLFLYSRKKQKKILL